MQASQVAFGLIMDFEGLSLKPYRCAAGVWSVGYGSTRNASALAEMGLELSLEQAKALLEGDVEKTVGALNRALEGIKLEQHQFDALVSLVYNIGPGAFEASTLLRKLRLGLIEEAGAEFDRWVYAKGRRLEGLAKRRAAEKAVFLGLRS